MEQNNYSGNNMNNDNYQVPPALKPREPGADFAAVSMIQGVLAIITSFFCTVFPPFILGGTSILFALLSKGYGKKMAKAAKRGIICAVCGIVLNCGVVGYMTTTFVTSYRTDASYRAQVNELCEDTYGMSFDDMLKIITGEETGVTNVEPGEGSI
ncbi:MAG: hypothetical protein PHP50_08640 [Lachnospiraceae bacterium]|nr:hypothetical protein [Lachnospiraceae bacterium]